MDSLILCVSKLGFRNHKGEVLKYEPWGSIATYLLMNYIEVNGAMYSGVRPWALCKCCWERHHLLWCIETKAVHWCRTLFHPVWCIESYSILFTSSTESSLVLQTLGARMLDIYQRTKSDVLRWCCIMWLFENLETKLPFTLVDRILSDSCSLNVATVYCNQEFITSSLPCARRRMSEIQFIRRSVQ